MHTVMVMGGGFLLLGACLLAAKLAGGSAGALTKAAIVFLPLWLIGAAVNMWFGVAKAGYSVREEFPVFCAVFAVPAGAALFILWRLKAS